MRGTVPLRSSRRNQSAFTLIEILIVAALIALLAGIAAINIQRVYVDNQRKATYGEVDQITKALSFAYFDFAVYPKLCFLSQNHFFIAPPDPGTPNQPGPYLVSAFEYMGFDINQNPTLANRVITNWAQGKGAPGYFSAGVGRRGMSQGRRGGTISMEIDINGYNPPVAPPGLQPPVYVVPWPADPWGRPYVVYMIYQEGVDPQTGLPNVDWVDSPTRAPNFALAVVSYGPNGVPGGEPLWTATDLLQGQQWALFDKFGRTLPDQSDYRALRPSEYDRGRLEAWSHERILGEPSNALSYIGVIDKGSDDIVKDFY